MATRSISSKLFARYSSPESASHLGPSIQRRTLSAIMDRSYAAALARLDQLQSNQQVTRLFAAAAAAGASPADARSLNERAMPEMRAWLSRGGVSEEDLSRLRCIHVAGTKGKGSVCAHVTAALLRRRGEAGIVGTYTSPHLVSVRERIALNGTPVTKEVFAREVFDLWEVYSDAARREGDVLPGGAVGASGEGGEVDADGPGTKPFYFRFLTVLALRIFLAHGVRSAVIECGIGGEYDATNVLPARSVTAAVVTQLGVDHVRMLGGTVEEIAWHKAGIFKAGGWAFTRRWEDRPGVMSVLRSRAQEKGARLVEVDDADVGRLLGPEGGDKGEAFQRQNQVLALAAVARHLDVLCGRPERDVLREPFDAELVAAMQDSRPRARQERLRYQGTEWFLDGAHTADSLGHVGRWFGPEMRKPECVTVLVYNQQERDAAGLLGGLLQALGEENSFTHAIFTRNEQAATVEGEAPRDLEVQDKAAQAMRSARPDTEVSVCDNVDAAVSRAMELAKKAMGSGKEVRILGTGSLYLVGGLLKALEPETES